MPRYAEKTLTKMNMELWLNHLFLTEGFYNNIQVGETNPYMDDMSRLASTTEDPTFPLPGMIWQSYFKEWVHESGITPSNTGIAPPTSVSGIFVNGVLVSSGVSIDYRNGRVLFSTPIPTTSLVQANFSYKDITVDFADEFEQENRPLLVETQIKDNPMQTGVIARPSYRARTLPLVLIDFRGRTSDGYELGSRSLIANNTGSLHIWARDNMTKDLIEELLCSREREVLMGINFNTAPFPLDSFGDKNPSYTSYGNLAQFWSPYFWHQIYMDEMTAVTDQPLANIERSRVDFIATVYPNF